MQVDTHAERGISFLRVVGKVNWESVDGLSKAFDESIHSGRTRIVLDLADAMMIDSSGLSAMIQARLRARSYGGDVKIAGIQENFMYHFQPSALPAAFEFYPSVTAAAGAFPDP